MTRWSAKLWGLLAGAIVLRSNPLAGAVIGLLIGHALDAGWFRGDVPRRWQGHRPDTRRPDPRDDPYRVFGLTAEASEAELDFAYRRLIARYHPDKAACAPDTVRAQAEQRSREINAAYDAIVKSRRR